MSGALALMAAAGGQQVPVLTNFSSSFLAPSGNASGEVLFHRNGTLQTLFADDPVTHFHPPRWGGHTPTSTMGDDYEVRGTHISGNNSLGDPEFEVLGTWFRINATLQFHSFQAVPAATNTIVTRFEIRRFGTTQILTSCDITLTFVQLD